MRLLALLTAAALLPALDIGDRAPALTGITWLKGAPVDTAGGITVVEFWATWCAPCQEAIPHLTALAKQHTGKIAVAGLSDEDEATVKPFIAAQGSAMDYPVGLIPEAGYAAWMGQRQGIPMAFVVARDGTVAWIGHPGELDAPLADIVAGTFDAARAKRVNALLAQLMALLQSQNEAFDAVLPKILTTSAALLAEDPTHLRTLQLRRGLAKQLKKPALFLDPLAAIPGNLTPITAAHVADFLLDEADLAFTEPALALRLARQAQHAAPDNAETCALLARAESAAGRLEAALAAQRRAYALAPSETAAAALHALEAMQQLQRANGE